MEVNRWMWTDMNGCESMLWTDGCEWLWTKLNGCCCEQKVNGKMWTWKWTGVVNGWMWRTDVNMDVKNWCCERMSTYVNHGCEQCEQKWTNVNGSGRIWTKVNGCEQMWSEVNDCEHMWTNVNTSEWMWMEVEGCEQMCDTKCFHYKGRGTMYTRRSGGVGSSWFSRINGKNAAGCTEKRFYRNERTVLRTTQCRWPLKNTREKNTSSSNIDEWWSSCE